MAGAAARALSFALIAWAVAAAPAQAQSARGRAEGRATIQEAATARIITNLLTQTAAILTIATGPGTVSSISVPGSVEARNRGGEASLSLPTSAAVLDAADGLGPAGLSVSIGEVGAAPGPGEGQEGPMLILVQYN